MKTTLVYKEIEWREVGDKPTKKDWVCNKTRPTEEENRWIRSRYSYIKASVGDHIWGFYQPCASFFNGFIDHPKDLDESALIEIEVLELQNPTLAVDEDEKFFVDNPALAQLREEMESSGQASFGRHSPQEWKGWAKVRCLRVVPLAQIPESFPIVPIEKHPEFHSYTEEQCQTANVTFHLTQYQEVIEWWMVTRGSPPYVILFCCEISNDPIEVWNWSLPD